ncbi:MAG: hypothetical protein P8L30_05630 [Longimicrobiales bacterium]|nr:hypothetical protein [Gemmatimonadales bacterium]MDG2239663.1 hypothetical protein [Longimicrobiales bacterium]
MWYFDTRAARIFVPVALAMVVVVTSCMDGPAAPDELANPTFGPALAFVPMFSLVGPRRVRSCGAKSSKPPWGRHSTWQTASGSSCFDERDRDRQDRGLPESLPALNRARLICFGRLSLPQESSLSATNIV